MIQTLLKNRKGNTTAHSGSKESGITIVEIMVAIVIIAAILVFTASGLTMSSKTSVYNENRTKAQAFANDVIAIAKQSPYRKAWIENESPDGNWGPGKCTELVNNLTPNGKTATVLSSGEGTSPFPNLEQCQVRQATNEKGPVGAVFYIQTQAYGITSANSSYKEVWVTVRWQDISVSPGQWNTFQTSVVLAPSVEDCFVTTAGYPAGTTLRSLNADVPGCDF